MESTLRALHPSKNSFLVKRHICEALNFQARTSTMNSVGSTPKSWQNFSMPSARIASSVSSLYLPNSEAIFDSSTSCFGKGNVLGISFELVFAGTLFSAGLLLNDSFIILGACWVYELLNVLVVTDVVVVCCEGFRWVVSVDESPTQTEKHLPITSNYYSCVPTFCYSQTTTKVYQREES